jgi:hypothetical protein
MPYLCATDSPLSLRDALGILTAYQVAQQLESEVGGDLVAIAERALNAAVHLMGLDPCAEFSPSAEAEQHHQDARLAAQEANGR